MIYIKDLYLGQSLKKPPYPTYENLNCFLLYQRVHLNGHQMIDSKMLQKSTKLMFAPPCVNIWWLIL